MTMLNFGIQICQQTSNKVPKIHDMKVNSSTTKMVMIGS